MSNFEKNKKTAVRLLCLILAGLMILGVGASAIFIIIDLINSASHGHSHLFAGEVSRVVLENANFILKGPI